MFFCEKSLPQFLILLVASLNPIFIFNKQPPLLPPPHPLNHLLLSSGATAAPAPKGVRRLQPLHWHAAGVSALAWAPGSGDCLLSGGFEGVLLVWNLEGAVTTNNNGGSSSSSSAAAAVAGGKPSFLPRLGGAVSHIQVSPDGTEATVSQRDRQREIAQKRRRRQMNL